MLARLLDPDEESPFKEYQFDVVRYIEEKLFWTPWAGENGADGQVQVIEAYELALRQLHERKAYREGDLDADDLEFWRPGETIQNYISIDAGHTVGKTKLLAGLVSHFFDCFVPSIVYCFAPISEQINDLLFKEIRVDRQNREDLTGRVLNTPRINHRPDHFVKGKATSDANSSGTERAQGQHGDYLLFVIDEAEGIPDFVWDAVSSMASGGIVMVIIARNPRTRTSEAHKIRERAYCRPFRISCLDHPNVIHNREIVRASVTRDYIESMLKETVRVEEHDEDKHTFELPWRPGEIYEPKQKFLWRVMGIPASFDADNTFCPAGRYEAAKHRPAYENDPPHIARMGIDAARYGSDHGTLFIRHGGRIWREALFTKADTPTYYRRVRAAALELAEQGVTDLVVRVDAGGGYGAGIADALIASHELGSAFEFFEVEEVSFNGTPYDESMFADKVTEMYYHGGQVLKHLALIDPPETLEADLCEREFTYKTRTANGVAYDVMCLVSKEQYKRKHQRSPDDGDGFALAAAPDYVFSPRVTTHKRLVYAPVQIGRTRGR